MMTQATVVPLVSLALALAACWCDLRTRRIPQLLTIGGALAGIGYHFASGGWQAGALSVAGCLAGLAVFFVPFALGGLGAGDVKLLGALGAWLGTVQVLWLALYAGAAGGALALVVALAHGYLKEAMVNIYTLIGHWRMNGPRPLAGMTLEASRGPRLAYAVPILAGTVATLWLR